MSEHPAHRIQVSGSPRFCCDVKRVQEELLQDAPDRYYQVISLMPRITQRDDRLAAWQTPEAYDRMQHDSDWYGGGEQGYQNWRWNFLHEVGHLAGGLWRGDWSDEKANQWANMVNHELNAAWYRRTW
jgi:hypothetical protein